MQRQRRRNIVCGDVQIEVEIEIEIFIDDRHRAHPVPDVAKMPPAGCRHRP